MTNTSPHRTMSRFRLLAILSILALPLGAQRPRQQQDVATLNALDAWVAQGVRDWDVPGLAIAIVKNDSVVFLKGYGVRERGREERVDAHTLFAIGSTTKAMTAALLGMAVDEKKLTWDTPAKTLLPQLELFDPVMTREVTVRDLLTHHTGLPGADVLWSGGDNTTAEIVRRARFIRPFASFRSKYAYMNVQYAIAGEVLRAATGRSWDVFLQERLFNPLGMRESSPTLAGIAPGTNVAVPHLRINDTIRVIANRPVDPVAPAGAVWSSVNDMAKWMRFVLDSGRVGGARLLSAATFRELLTPQVVVPAESYYPTASLTRPHAINYGLGWFLQDYRGHAVAMHTGSIDGMIAIIGLIPDQRLGVYVLANLDHAELRHALMYRVFDTFTAGPTRDWSRELRTLYDGLARQGREAAQRRDAQRVMGTRPSLALDRYAGVYSDSLAGSIVVRMENGAPTITAGKSFHGTLTHWHYDTFRVEWDDRRAGRSEVTFVLGAEGLPVSVRVELEGAIEFMRVRDAGAR